MKRSGFKSRSKPLAAKTPMRKVSRKKAARRQSKEGQSGLRYMRAVKQLGCCVCGMPPPSDAHHCISGRYGTRKASDFETIPLCRNCHQDGPNAIHRAKASWEAIHGPDTGHIKPTRRLVAMLDPAALDEVDHDAS